MQDGLWAKVTQHITVSTMHEMSSTFWKQSLVARRHDNNMAIYIWVHGLRRLLSVVMCQSVSWIPLPSKRRV